MNIAVIPARGGSKRIPRKNIKHFCGKPMIAWSIDAAKASGDFDSILVSTDDDDIAAIAREYGAETPFRRPPELSNDHAPTIPVIAHAVRWFEENRSTADFVCCIYATAPFLQPRYLSEGLMLLKSHPDGEFTFGVTSFPYPIYRALKCNADGSISMCWPEHEKTRSQDLPGTLHDAGQFYWGRQASFTTAKGIFSARSYPVFIPRLMVQDIDTPEDWDVAEKMFALTKQNHV